MKKRNISLLMRQPYSQSVLHGLRSPTSTIPHPLASTAPIAVSLLGKETARPTTSQSHPLQSRITSCQQPRLRKPSSGCIETGFPRSRGFSPTSQVRLPFPSAFSSTGCSCASRVFLVSHMGCVQELSRFVFSAEMNFVKHFRLFSQL